MEIKFNSNDEEIIDKFYKLSCRSDVADLLEIEDKTLIYLLYRKDKPKYTNFRLLKKNGGFREISSPNYVLKNLQKKLQYIFTLIYYPKPSVHGYTKNKSILTNAQNHINKNIILNIDLKDFFPSINFGRVRGLFLKRFNLQEDAATVLAQICTYNNSLPQGSPTSPIISNIICSNMDRLFQKLAKKYYCSYTRYADDISISTNLKKFPNQLAFFDESSNLKLGKEINDIIELNGFAPNYEKIRLKNKQGRLEVTGLTVNKFPNVSRKYIRQIRAMLNAWEKYGADLAEKEFQIKFDKKNRGENKLPKYSEVVRGKINFLKMVRGERDALFQKIAMKFNQLYGSSCFPIYFEEKYKEITSALWVLECEEEMKQGTGFMLEGVGLVTCSHVLGTKTQAFQYDNFEKLPVEVVYNDVKNDVAILKIPQETPKFLRPAKNQKFEHGFKITVAGFPNYSIGDTPYINDGKLTLHRKSQNRFMVSATIVTGNSGGPVLNSDNEVIGIAVLGVDEFSQSSTTEKHGVIPIQIIDYLIST